jgi:hypothetical protein
MQFFQTKETVFFVYAQEGLEPGSSYQLLQAMSGIIISPLDRGKLSTM